jgi:hypothetical protein
MFNVLAIGSVVASILGAPAPVATSDIPSEKITVNVQSINGSGCPAGSAEVVASSDNTSFSVAYDDYVAAAGAGAKPTDFRKNCQISLRVNVPQGFTYAIAQADYRGHARLARGVVGRQNAYYYFMGTAPTAEVQWHLDDHQQGRCRRAGLRALRRAGQSEREHRAAGGRERLGCELARQLPFHGFLRRWHPHRLSPQLETVLTA